MRFFRFVFHVVHFRLRCAVKAPEAARMRLFASGVATIFFRVMTAAPIPRPMGGITTIS